MLRYSKGSNLSNIIAVKAHVHRRDDFRKAVTEGPPESALRGPILTGVRYPDVLVGRAFSNGDDLELVLYPGTSEGPQQLRIERLRPGARYAMRNGSDHPFVADNSGAADLSVSSKAARCCISFPRTIESLFGGERPAVMFVVTEWLRNASRSSLMTCSTPRGGTCAQWRWRRSVAR